MERRHLGQRQRGPELRRRPSTSATTSATTGPTSSSRPPPGCGTPGRTTPSSSTASPAVFADPDKVHELDYEGEWFQVRGPLTVPRSPQGRPVLLQAGSSGRGRDFAARWAELIFTGDPDIDIARAHYKDQKERIAAEVGRDPDTVKMLPDGLHGRRGVAGPGRGARAAASSTTSSIPMASLTLLSELMNYDFSGMELDDPDHRRARSSPCRASGAWCRTSASTSAATRHPRRPGRPPGHPAPGAPLRRHRRRTSPTRWRSGSTTDACDGFVIAATHSPGRLRGRGPPGRARAAAPRRVPRPLHGHHPPRAPRPRPPRGAPPHG